MANESMPVLEKAARQVGQDATPLMDEDARQLAQQLSFQHVRPPIRLPGYEQEKFLGKGAFGEIWVAINSNNGRKVAIKFYSRRGGLDWSLLTREVEKLRHLFTDRYVVQLFEVGWEADPPYYVMEYMENGSLEEKLSAGPLAVSEAVDLFREIAVGLVHAHGRGVLHCDLKPANILLDQDYKPRLADFGQSRLSKEQSPALGTLFYMAPEQADLKAVPDARWDVYALGAILYRMLTGQPPYRSEAAADEIMNAGRLEERLKRYRRLLTESPRPSAHRNVAGIDAALVEIIDRCLAVKPQARFPNVQAVLDALKARMVKQARRPLLLLGTLGPALMMVVMAVSAIWYYGESVSTAEKDLIDRTLEADGFAAKSLADYYGRQISKRWSILEREVNEMPLRSKLASLGSGSASDKAMCAGLQEWLKGRHKYWDEEAPSRGSEPLASEWFVDDRNGYQRAVSPPDEPHLNMYFGYRDYFHGTGRDRGKDEKHLPPITKPHLSVPFKEVGGTEAWTVAVTVPIRIDPARGDPVGILGLMWVLEGLPKVEGARNQKVVLLDTKMRGIILQHPYLEDLRKQGTKEFPVLFNERIIGGIEDPRHYTDPLGEKDKEYAGPWLAALSQVIVPDRPKNLQAPGWVIVVQEREKRALEPLQVLSRKFTKLAVLSFVVVLAVVLALWSGVWLIQSGSRGRRLLTALRRRLGLPTESAVSSVSSASSSVSTASERTRSGVQPATREGSAAGHDSAASGVRGNA